MMQYEAIWCNNLFSRSFFNFSFFNFLDHSLSGISRSTANCQMSIGNIIASANDPIPVFALHVATDKHLSVAKLGIIASANVPNSVLQSVYIPLLSVVSLTVSSEQQRGEDQH